MHGMMHGIMQRRVARADRVKVTDSVPDEDQPARSLWDGPASDGFSLPDARPVSAIRDSLYDFIPLGQLELDLIGAPEFVRLQGVKQLGFCYRVWPGATHTRFEHSLGVYFLARRVSVCQMRSRSVRSSTNTVVAPSASVSVPRTAGRRPGSRSQHFLFRALFLRHGRRRSRFRRAFRSGRRIG